MNTTKYSPVVEVAIAVNKPRWMSVGRLGLVGGTARRWQRYIIQSNCRQFTRWPDDDNGVPTICI